jgi:hypothetical protein
MASAAKERGDAPDRSCGRHRLSRNHPVPCSPVTQRSRAPSATKDPHCATSLCPPNACDAEEPRRCAELRRAAAWGILGMSRLDKGQASGDWRAGGDGVDWAVVDLLGYWAASFACCALTLRHVRCFNKCARFVECSVRLPPGTEAEPVSRTFQESKPKPKPKTEKPIFRFGSARFSSVFSFRFLKCPG